MNLPSDALIFAFMKRLLVLLAFSLSLAGRCALAQDAAPAPAAMPWMNAALDPDARADLLVKAMTAKEMSLPWQRGRLF